GVAVDDRDVDARQRAHGGAGLGRGDPGQRGDHDGAGLRLPPGVHDGDGRTADVIAVPAPRLGVDGLADGAEQPDRGQVVPGRDLPAPLHERPDERGRGVVDAHAVLLDDLEVAVLVRGVGGALVDHAGGAVGERAVHAIGVAGDPADVGGAPVDVLAGLVVEHDVVRVGRLREVAARGVDDALGLAGGAGGVEDEQGVLGVERLRCVVGGLLGDDLVPPDVAVV